MKKLIRKLAPGAPATSLSEAEIALIIAFILGTLLIAANGPVLLH